MADVPSPDPPALQHLLDHLLSRLSAHRIASESQAWARPLFVGIQGPQGSGKSLLTALAVARLASRSPPVHAAVLGLDDLYLPHAELVRVARTHPDNVLLQGRGQPGTHDIPLGNRVLRALTAINDAPAEGPKEVKLPTFDKSAHAGEGDRAPPEAFLAVTAPLDVVLFEGWCVGFMPCDASEISVRRARPVPGLPVFDLAAFCAQDAAETVSEYLAGYREWWDMLDAFVQLAPASGSLAHVYRWRTEQEHALKARNGGRGMSDEQVRRFVDRYVPGYVYFGDGVHDPGASWAGRGLRIVIDGERAVVSIESF